ncbi:MAG: hypothetical protein PHQ23_08180 [Candidatus Wallbacteria bacterium]|nr:hypothetical protein [Candidatus Wallbacteria bacterium]
MKAFAVALLLLMMTINLPLRALDASYRKRVEAENEVEKIRRIDCPREFQPLLLEIENLLSRGIFYYKLEHKETAISFFEQVLEKVEIFRQTLRLDPYHQKVMVIFDERKLRMAAMEENEFNVFFPDGWSSTVAAFDEAGRSIGKSDSAIDGYEYKVARRRDRYAKIVGLLDEVDRLLAIYEEKVGLFHEIGELEKSIKAELDAYNATRDIARKPKELFSVRKKMQDLTARRDVFLMKAKESIYYVGVEELKLLKYDFCDLSGDFARLRVDLHRPVYEERAGDKMAQAILTDDSFQLFFPDDYQVFYLNYQRYRKWKSNSYSPQDIEMTETYLERALQVERKYLEFTQHRGREKKLSDWLSEIGRDKYYTERNQKSFYFFGAKNALKDAVEARKSGNYRKYLEALNNGERCREKF